MNINELVKFALEQKGRIKPRDRFWLALPAERANIAHIADKGHAAGPDRMLCTPRYTARIVKPSDSRAKTCVKCLARLAPIADRPTYIAMLCLTAQAIPQPIPHRTITKP